MLYFLYGKDGESARLKARELLETLQKKKPDAELFTIDSDSWDAGRLEELMGSQGLFEKKFIVFLDRVFENKEAKEIVLEKLKEIGASENVFIVLEGGLDKKTADRFEKNATKAQKFEKKEDDEKKDEGFKIFSLADAFGKRDKKSLWVLYQKAIDSGAVPEEIHGILFWQMKSIALASKTSNAKEAGLNPYVFTKSKSFAKNFSHEEIPKLLRSLVRIYHDAHSGLLDFDLSLEKFILSL